MCASDAGPSCSGRMEQSWDGPVAEPVSRPSQVGHGASHLLWAPRATCLPLNSIPLTDKAAGPFLQLGQWKDGAGITILAEMSHRSGLCPAEPGKSSLPRGAQLCQGSCSAGRSTPLPSFPCSLEARLTQQILETNFSSKFPQARVPEPVPPGSGSEQTLFVAPFLPPAAAAGGSSSMSERY